MAPTRRTHMVRIYAVDDSGNESKDTYVDVEVLDAVAFRIDRGKQVILDMPASKCSPYIVDNTDGGLGKDPGRPTRRTHVKKIKSSDGTTDIYYEVFDAAAYRDEMGKEWIITGPDNAPYDATDGSGAGGATRRCHDEKISATDPKTRNPSSDFMTVQRTDMLAFRSVRGEEMIIKMPSFDDGNGDRADTYISNMPGNTYDPTSDDPDAAPPENKDPHFYLKVKGTSLVTGDTKIAQGPFWWIRKIKAGGGLVFCNFLYSAHSVDVQPSLGEPTMLHDTPWSAPPTDIFSSSGISFPASGPTPQNPVTGAMRAQLDQWSVDGAPVRTATETSAEGSVGAWSTYSASTDASLGFGRRPIGPPTADNINSPTYFLGFSAVIGLMPTESVGPNVIVNPYNPRQSTSGEGDNFVPYSGCWGLFTDKSTAQAACDAANAIIAYDAQQGAAGPLLSDWTVVNVTPATSHKTFSALGEVSFILNSGKAKTTKNKDGDPVYTFKLDVPDMGTTGNWSLSMCAFDSTIKDFPVDANHAPTFKPFQDDANPSQVGQPLLDPKTGKPHSGAVVGAAGGNGARTLTVTVNTKTFEITIDG